MTSEPIWVTRPVVDAIHLDQLQKHGGRFGVRDENLLESALARPQQRWAYEEGADLADLAASYAFGIAKNHPFIDGNKRTAFMVLYTFLRTNGIRLGASEPEAVEVMLGVASGELGEGELAAWCRQRGTPVNA
ncbi:MAG: type II toxin-antitoxin system death-on-curing family toxin [Bacteroidota bacterium]